MSKNRDTRSACFEAANKIVQATIAMGFQASLGWSRSSDSRYVYVTDGEKELEIRISDHDSNRSDPDYVVACDAEAWSRMQTANGRWPDAVSWVSQQLKDPS